MNEIAQRFSAGTLFFVVLSVGIILSWVITTITRKKFRSQRAVGIVGLIVYGGLCYIIAKELAISMRSGWLGAILIVVICGFLPLGIFISLAFGPDIED